MAIPIAMTIAVHSNAQMFKKNSQQQELDRSDYAYQTISTQKKKVKKHGYASDEARFQFEKPEHPLPKSNYNRPAGYSLYTFGHRRSPTRRPIGKTKLCKVCGISH